MMKANASLQVLEGKIEELTELCRRFNVKRLEIFAPPLPKLFVRSRAIWILLLISAISR
jgi:hypothetical protein